MLQNYKVKSMITIKNDLNDTLASFEKESDAQRFENAYYLIQNFEKPKLRQNPSFEEATGRKITHIDEILEKLNYAIFGTSDFKITPRIYKFVEFFFGNSSGDLDDEFFITFAAFTKKEQGSLISFFRSINANPCVYHEAVPFLQYFYITSKFVSLDVYLNLLKKSKGDSKILITMGYGVIKGISKEELAKLMLVHSPTENILSSDSFKLVAKAYQGNPISLAHINLAIDQMFKDSSKYKSSMTSLFKRFLENFNFERFNTLYDMYAKEYLLGVNEMDPENLRYLSRQMMDLYLGLPRNLVDDSNRYTPDGFFKLKVDFINTTELLKKDFDEALCEHIGTEASNILKGFGPRLYKDAFTAYNKFDAFLEWKKSDRFRTFLYGQYHVLFDIFQDILIPFFKETFVFDLNVSTFLEKHYLVFEDTKLRTTYHKNHLLHNRSYFEENTHLGIVAYASLLAKSGEALDVIEDRGFSFKKSLETVRDTALNARNLSGEDIKRAFIDVDLEFLKEEFNVGEQDYFKWSWILFSDMYKIESRPQRASVALFQYLNFIDENLDLFQEIASKKAENRSVVETHFLASFFTTELFKLTLTNKSDSTVDYGGQIGIVPKELAPYIENRESIKNIRLRNVFDEYLVDFCVADNSDLENVIRTYGIQFFQFLVVPTDKDFYGIESLKPSFVNEDESLLTCILPERNPLNLFVGHSKVSNCCMYFNGAGSSCSENAFETSAADLNEEYMDVTEFHFKEYDMQSHILLAYSKKDNQFVGSNWVWPIKKYYRIVSPSNDESVELQNDSFGDLSDSNHVFVLDQFEFSLWFGNAFKKDTVTHFFRQATTFYKNKYDMILVGNIFDTEDEDEDRITLSPFTHVKYSDYDENIYPAVEEDIYSDLDDVDNLRDTLYMISLEENEDFVNFADNAKAFVKTLQEYKPSCEMCGESDYPMSEYFSDPNEFSGPICDSCITRCDDCGEIVDRDYAIYDEDDNIYICYQCAKTCDSCGESVAPSNVTEVDNQDICSKCYEESVRSCDECHDSFLSSNLTTVRDVGVSVKEMCESCLEYTAQDCDECGEVYIEDLLKDGVCEKCYVEEEDED